MGSYKPGEMFTCKECGEDFELTYYRDRKPKYCGRSCYENARRNRIEITCAECEATIKKQPSRITDDGPDFCSVECRDNYAKGNRSIKKDGSKKHFPKGSSFCCDNCNEMFSISYSRRGRPRYCSQECHYEDRREELIECETCGGLFHKPQSQVELADHHFCSYRCRDTWQEKKVEVRCSVCEKTEMVTPFRAEKYVACSYECQIKWQEKHHSGENNASFLSNINEDKIITLYEDGYSSRTIASMLGISPPTVIDRLEKNDIELRLGSGYGHTCETEKGHMVRSSLEKQVADYLYRNDIGYEYEPEEFKGPYIPDFVLSDGRILEVWGLVGMESYEETRASKEEWYNKNSYHLISVVPSDIEKLPSLLDMTE